MPIQSTKGSLSEKTPHCSLLGQAGIWIHKHPTTVKVAQVAGVVLGAGMMAPAVLGVAFFETSSVVALAAVGSFLAPSSVAGLLALDYIISPHHDMKNHVYKPGQCEGGKLYYEGDVPILSLESDNPFIAGKAHGYLCGEAISHVAKRFDLMLHEVGGSPRADSLPNTLAKIRQTIPDKYLREIEGVVEGYNKWAGEQYWWQFSKKLTLDDALLIHLMPEGTHFDPGFFEKWVASEPSRRQAVACTATIDRDPRKELEFARNMDWPSFGIAGTYSLVINRRYSNGLQNTVEVGVPGFIGTLTGMNRQGLSVAMNVSSGWTKRINGMPAVFYNRACLETCRNVTDVDSFVHRQSPLGPYHLTAADQNKGQSFHFYQSITRGHVVRRWRKNHPLTTLNFHYSPKPSRPVFYCEERQQNLDRFFQQRRNRPLEEALSLPFVNNWLTTHRVVMEPKSRTLRVAFDNAFAGHAPLHSVPTERLLS